MDGGTAALCIVSAKMTLEGNGGRAADVVITHQNLILEPPFCVRCVNAPCEVLLKVPFWLFLLAHLLRLSVWLLECVMYSPPSFTLLT